MWDWAIWAALIAGGIAVAAASAFFTVRALETWRELERARGVVFQELDELTAQGEVVADNAARAADTSEAMASVERLRVSLARLAVLREAVDEAQHTFGRLASVMPRR